MKRRLLWRLLWGTSAAAVYLASAAVLARTGVVGPRPLYDGLAPAAPYRFVSPPPDLATGNEKPEPGKGVIDLVGKGSAAASISTGDGQMQVVLPKGTFLSRKREKTIDVRIDPLAPAPPLDLDGGLKIEGNAYGVHATYSSDGDPAEARRELTIVLRYPSNATVIVRREGRTWTRLKTQISQASLQLFAGTDRLGTFAAAGKPHRRWPTWLPYAAGLFGVLAGVGGYLSGRRGWLRRTKPKRRRRAKSTSSRRR